MAIEDYYLPIIVQRKTQDKNIIGGTSNDWNNVLETTGLINRESSGMVFKAGKHLIESTHKLFTAVDQDINKLDRVLDEDGNVYMIISTLQDTVHRGHHWLIHLRKLELTAAGLIYVTVDGFIYVTDEGA